MVGDHDQFECNRPLFFGIDEQHAAPSSRQSEKGKANRLAWCTSALYVLYVQGFASSFGKSEKRR